MTAFTFYSSSTEYRTRNLKHKFPGCETVNHYEGQAGQDLFVLTVLNGLRDGTYIELGGRDPIIKNNTYVLETFFDWNGFSVDASASCFDLYNNTRRNKTILSDARIVNYKQSLLDMCNYTDNVFDYLSADLDTWSTFETTQKIIDEGLRPKVITFEHDAYTERGKDLKPLSREYFKGLGYTLVANAYKGTDHEDWWVDLNYVDNDAIRRIIELESELPTMELYEYFFENIA